MNLTDGHHQWENPVPMPCDSEFTSRSASWHRFGCPEDAGWIIVKDGTVERFLCYRCACEYVGRLL